MLFATSSSGWGGRRKLPYAFAEHGALMAANVVSSPTAVRASIVVVRAFVRLREILATHKDLARKLEDLERKYKTHDVAIREIFDAIRKLMAPPPEPKRRIGFTAPEILNLSPSAPESDNCPLAAGRRSGFR